MDTDTLPMPTLRRARTLSVGIAAPFSTVYAFVSDARSLPEWAHGLGASPRPLGDNRWELATAAGPVDVEFAAPNTFGVVDHVVTPTSGGAPVDVPMRVLKNGEGSEVLFTLFQQPGMTDEQFAQDAALVDADLARLKQRLERAS